MAGRVLTQEELIAKGEKYLEKRRRNSQTYRDRLRTKGVVSTTIRLPEDLLDQVKERALREGATINDVFLALIRRGCVE